MLETVPVEAARARLQAAGYAPADTMHGVVEVWRRARDGREVLLTPERDGSGVSAYLEQMIRGAEEMQAF